jgi:hypothetical protein
MSSKKPPKAASSIFQTGPDDDLVAVDSRGKAAKEQLAKAKPKPGVQEKTLNRLKNTKLNAADLAKMTSFKDGVGLDKKAALGRLDNVLGQNVSGITGDNNALKERAAGNLISMFGDGRYDEIVGEGGEIIKVARGTDTGKATSLMKSINQWNDVGLVGNLVDKTSWLAGGVQLLELANAFGIPQAIDSVMSKLRTEKLAKRRLIDGLRGSVLRGDIPTVNKIIDYIGVEAAKQKVPNMPTLLLSGYRFPPKTEVAQYAGMREELLALLTRIDPNWATVEWKGERISNLAPFRSISQSSRILLTLGGDPTYRVQVLIGNKYRSRSIIDLGRDNFPQTVAWVR